MSEGLAQQMANEWETYVRQYAKKHPGRNPFTSSLQMMIEDDVERTEGQDFVEMNGDFYRRQHRWLNRDVAKRAVEILKERIQIDKPTSSGTGT